MSSRLMLAAALALAASAPAVAQSPAAPTRTPSTAPAQDTVAARYSPEKLAAIRHALTSRMAVYDAGEQAMRRPSAAEAAALASKETTASQRVVGLANGGVALKAGAESVEYLIVDVGADGRRTMRHGDAASVAPKSSRKEGHRHAQ